MRLGFSLIEVVIAAAILAIAGFAALSMSEKNLKLSGYLKQKAKLGEYNSIIAYQHNTDFNGKEKTLYDFVEDDFNITHDGMRQYLKKIKVRYEESEVETLELTNDDSESDITVDGGQYIIYKAKLIKEGVSTHVYFMAL